MKEQKMGIDYFCIETDIKDDDKVFALRYLYATKAGGYDVGACPSKWATRRRSWTRS